MTNNSHLLWTGSAAQTLAEQLRCTAHPDYGGIQIVQKQESTPLSDHRPKPIHDGVTMAASVHDRSRFVVIHDQYAEDIYAYCARRVGHQVAEDLVADVFLTAFKNRAQFNPEEKNARPWLYGIAANLLLKHHRAQTRQLTAYRKASQLAATSTEEDIEQVERHLDAARSVALITEFLTALPTDDKEALLLYAWAGLSYPEIARALDIPLGTVRSRIHRARKTLKNMATKPPTQGGQQ